MIEGWLDRRFVLVCHALQTEGIRDVSRQDKIRVLVRPAEVGRLVNQIGLVADMPADCPMLGESLIPGMIFSLAYAKLGEPIGSSRETRTICSRSDVVDRAASSRPPRWPMSWALAKGDGFERNSESISREIQPYAVTVNGS